MGKLTTHMLDTAAGRPGSGIQISLYRLDEGRHLVTSATTNDDGRTDAPLLQGDTFALGTYELQFSIGEYFKKTGASNADHAFLDEVVIRINLITDDHYHIPLLASPWSYSTYRGS